MRDVRMHWKESRIFLGKNTIAQVALGRTSEEEYKENLHCISEVIINLVFLIHKYDLNFLII
jgi:mRNA turnover protein 4